MLAALEEGYNVATTADVPKEARVAGLGIVKLAQIRAARSIPVAIATSRRIVLDNWDSSVINLPFSDRGGVAGTAIRVPRNADDAALEAARQAVENGLNVAMARSIELADRSESRVARRTRRFAARSTGCCRWPSRRLRRFSRAPSASAARNSANGCASGAASRPRIAPQAH